MIGANTTISTYRRTRSGGKDTFAVSATLNGVPVALHQEQLERAIHIDNANASRIYRMISTERLDIQEGDKVVDADSVEYRVHSVQQDPRDFAMGNHTIVILRRQT